MHTSTIGRVRAFAVATAAIALAAAGTTVSSAADPETTPGGPWPQGEENTNAIRSYEQLWSTLHSIEGRAKGSFDLSPAPLTSNTGREIPVVTIGDGDTDIMFVANQHGDEFIVSNAMINVIRTLSGGSAEVITGLAVSQAAREGDPAALECFQSVAEWTGQGMADLAATLDPGAFIIGGGLSAVADLLLEPIKKAFAGAVTGHGHRRLADVRVAELGPDAGIVGAADLARQ